MLADTFLQRSNILPPRNRNCHQPAADQQQRNPADLACWQMQGGGENENRQAGQAVTQAPDHGIDEPFHLQLDPGRKRKIEQFGGGLVDGIAQHLVAAFQRDGCAQRPKNQQACRTQEHGNGKHEYRRTYSKPAQEPCGEQQLEQQREYAGVKVEVTVESSYRIFFHQELLHEGQKLPTGQGGHKRRNTDHGRDGP